MSPPTKSSNDDKQPSSEAQLNLQLLNDVLPYAVQSECAGTGRKRALDQFDSGAFKPIDHNNMAEMQARMDAVLAKRRKTAPQVDKDVEMVVTGGSTIKIDMNRPAPPNNRPLDWPSFQNPKHAPKVALKVGEGLVIGNAGYHPAGYGINLLLDGGINGRPSVSLIIRFNKNNQGQALCTDKNDVHRFVVQYNFDSIIGSDDQGKDLFMVESFSHAAFHPSQPPEVPDLLWRQGCAATQTCRPNNHFKIITMKMKVQGVRVTEGIVPENLQDHSDILFAKAVTELLDGPFPTTLVFWFEWKKHAVASEECLGYLQRVIESRPPQPEQSHDPDE